MSWDEERPSIMARLRSLPTAVQVSAVLTAGIVMLDLMRGVRDITLSIIQLLRGLGGCAGLAILALMVLATGADAQKPCTRGTNCYCDRVRTNASVGGLPNIFDGALLMCEDFEALTLHDNVNAGGGAPNWGPVYDSRGTGNRGLYSYWTNTYLGIVNSCLWPNGVPASPTLGQTCNVGGGECSGAPFWHPQNLWQGNIVTACNAVFRNGEFGAEVPGVTDPTNASGGTSGAFDGLQSHASRVA